MLPISILPHTGETLQDIAYKAYVRKNTKRFSHLKYFTIFDDENHLRLISEVIKELWPMASISRVAQNSLLVVR